MASNKVNGSESTLLMVSILLVGSLVYLNGLFAMGTFLVGGRVETILWIYLLILPIGVGTLVLSPYLTIAGEEVVSASPELPKIQYIVDKNATRLGLRKKVKVYIVESDDLNAFTFGIRKPNLAITKGCLERLDDNELNTLVLHELSHVENRDVWFMTWNIWFIKSVILWFTLYIATYFFLFYVSAITSIPRILGFCCPTLISLLLAIVIPLILIAHFSRTRELIADARACAALGNSSVLIDTIKKIYRHNCLKSLIKSLLENKRKNKLSFIVRSKANAIVTHLFSFHPPVSFRIKSIQQEEYNADEPTRFARSTSVLLGLLAGYLTLYLDSLLLRFDFHLMHAFNVPVMGLSPFGWSIARAGSLIDLAFTYAHETVFQNPFTLFLDIPCFLVYPPFWYVVIGYLFSGKIVKSYRKLFLRILLSWITYFFFLSLLRYTNFVVAVSTNAAAGLLYGWFNSLGFWPSDLTMYVIFNLIIETSLVATLSFPLIVLLKKMKSLITQKMRAHTGSD